MADSDQQFPAGARLKTRADYDHVFADAVRVGGRYFTILVRRSACGRARIGLIVSRKVDRRAVGRNRLKRQVRESFRFARHRILPVDCAVLARPAARGASNAELRAELDRQWREVTRKAERVAGTH